MNNSKMFLRIGWTNSKCSRFACYQDLILMMKTAVMKSKTFYFPILLYNILIKTFLVKQELEIIELLVSLFQENLVLLIWPRCRVVLWTPKKPFKSNSMFSHCSEDLIALSGSNSFSIRS